MKKIIVEMGDHTKSEIVEKVEIKHLSDLGEGVKEVVENFVKMNKGVVMPPVSIQVTAVPETATDDESPKTDTP